jgi:hypothetical protein
MMGSSPRRRVAIVVPLYASGNFTPAHEISLRHLEHFLGGYDRYFIAPPSLRVERAGFRVARFPDRYFGTPIRAGKLMLAPRFYEAFQSYEFILVYHLDALVFSDQLLEWCDRGFDYIGPPWLDDAGVPWGVGNGGFCLRRISGMLSVLRSRRYSIDPDEYWKANYAHRSLPVRVANLPRMYLKRLPAFNGIRREIEITSRGTNWYGEDLFLADHAKKYWPEFSVAPVDEALRFGWEVNPRACAERSGLALPFGCHAWERYDRAFWEPHLLRA